MVETIQKLKELKADLEDTGVYDMDSAEKLDEEIYEMLEDRMSMHGFTEASSSVGVEDMLYHIKDILVEGFDFDTFIQEL